MRSLNPEDGDGREAPEREPRRRTGTKVAMVVDVKRGLSGAQTDSSRGEDPLARGWSVAQRTARTPPPAAWPAEALT